MTNNFLTLFCLVNGESTPFPVKIESTETIGGLKKAIKDKIPDTFNGVDSKDLTLWRVSIPVPEDDDNELPILLNNIVTKDKKKLSPTTRLSKVFPAELPDETIHIIVQRPARPSVGLHPEVATLRKQLSEMEQLNLDMRSTSISMAIVDKRSGGNKKVCQYVSDTMTGTFEELRQLLRPHFEQFDGDDYVQIYLYQPGNTQPVLVGNDDVLRSCLKIAKDNGHKNFTVSLDSPAKEFSSYTWKDAQSQYGVREEVELMTPFDIEPKLLLEDEKTVLKHIVEDCVFKNKAYLLGPSASEATKTSVVDSFMVGAIQSYTSKMFLSQQRPMSGMRGHGAVDFAVVDRVYQSQVLGVTEVKRGNDHAQGLAQNMAELDVAVQQKKRKRMDELDEGSGERSPACFKSYGIVTDSFRWTLVECTLDEGDVLTFRAKDIPGFLDLKQPKKEDVEKDCEKVFSFVLALYELMKDEIINRSAYGSPSSDTPPSKRIATGSHHT